MANHRIIDRDSAHLDPCSITMWQDSFEEAQISQSFCRDVALKPFNLGWCIGWRVPVWACLSCATTRLLLPSPQVANVFALRWPTTRRTAQVPFQVAEECQRQLLKSDGRGTSMPWRAAYVSGWTAGVGFFGEVPMPIGQVPWSSWDVLRLWWFNGY